MVVDVEGGDVFLFLPRVLLEGEVSVDGCGAIGLDLLVVGCLLEWVRAEGGRELSNTMLPMGGRSLSKGIMSKKASEKSSPFLTDLDLAELFLPGIEMFVTFAFFSKPVG